MKKYGPMARPSLFKRMCLIMCEGRRYWRETKEDISKEICTSKLFIRICFALVITDPEEFLANCPPSLDLKLG